MGVVVFHLNLSLRGGFGVWGDGRFGLRLGRGRWGVGNLHILHSLGRRIDFAGGEIAFAKHIAAAEAEARFVRGDQDSLMPIGGKGGGVDPAPHSRLIGGERLGHRGRAAEPVHHRGDIRFQRFVVTRHWSSPPLSLAGP